MGFAFSGKRVDLPDRYPRELRPRSNRLFPTFLYPWALGLCRTIHLLGLLHQAPVPAVAEDNTFHLSAGSYLGIRNLNVAQIKEIEEKL